MSFDLGASSMLSTHLWRFCLKFSSAFIRFHEIVSFTELGKFSLICFHIRLLLCVWYNSHSFLKPTELPEHCTGIFYFICCGLSRNYSTTIEVLPQIVGVTGLEPARLAAQFPKLVGNQLPVTPRYKISP